MKKRARKEGHEKKETRRRKREEGNESGKEQLSTQRLQQNTQAFAYLLYQIFFGVDRMTSIKTT